MCNFISMHFFVAFNLYFFLYLTYKTDFFNFCNDGRLIRLMHRGMRIDQALFPWESNPTIQFLMINCYIYCIFFTLLITLFDLFHCRYWMLWCVISWVMCYSDRSCFCSIKGYVNIICESDCLEIVDMITAGRDHTLHT